MPKKPLNQVLFDEPYRFEFFQAVRLFEKLFPEHQAVGREALPSQEVVRFRSYIALDFPPSEIREIREPAAEAADDAKVEMLVNFMGLVGVSGVLPTHYTELVLDRIRHRDTSMWAFLDIFTHRSVSMFYRAWAKYRFPVGYERGEDEFTGYLFDFAGLGTKGLRGHLNIQDESLLPYAGLIAQKPHSTNALENIVSDYFGITAKIEQFFGQWLALDNADFTKLGAKNSTLGLNAIAGKYVWEQQSKFRVRLEGLTFKQFQAFLPNGSASKSLDSIIRFMAGPEFDFDVQLVLKAKQVPGAILTTRALRKPMLCWTSYLKTIPFKKDDKQVVLAFNS
ncbi:MAG: type VI secretion system baseplate subunit TssG [Saprospiraceae bacterium]|nr:type VI secretion system baseplate subunit TssG [Pyrinomonadaceae bacterium]